MLRVAGGEEETMSEETACASALAAGICPALSIAQPDSDEIYRYLGYRAGRRPRPALATRIDGLLAEALTLLHPRGAWALYAASHSSLGALEIASISISGRISEFLSCAERVAVFVVTVGQEISLRSLVLSHQGDAFSAWVLDAIGSWAAESAADALQLQLRPHLAPDQELTLRYSPGYCGMALDEQRSLFRLVAAEALGVQLLPSLLMHPLKTVSGLIGLSPAAAVDLLRSPCDHCSRTGCPMRRPGQPLLRKL